MSSSEPIIVFEHSWLSIGEQGFGEDHFNALVKFNDLHTGKYFNVGFRKIIFKSYVGVIQAGNRVIEVLPKADRHADIKDACKWQRALLDMLKMAGYIKLNQTGEASLHTRNNNLMDIYLYTFLKEVDALVHAGLVKKYRRFRANQTSLKGKLLIEKQLKHNLIHQERFYTEHTVYDRDNIFNAVLKTALDIIRDTTTNNSIKQEVTKLTLYFDGITAWQGNPSDLDKVKPDRKTIAYRYALDLAKMIILNYNPDMKAGKQSILSLLFNMNLLFEKFVFHLLKREESNFSNNALAVTAQNSVLFWAHKTIRPDIMIRFRKDGDVNENNVIIDTKWKIADEGYPSDNDLKQMFTYNIQFNSGHAVLLYPSVGQENRGRTQYKDSGNSGFLHSCEMYFIHLFDDKGGINKLAGVDFLNYIIQGV